MSFFRQIRTAVSLTTLLVAAPAIAELTEFEITRREPFAGGKEFGTVGAYERISGTVHFSIDPTAKSSQQIVDLQHAPTDASGRVNFSADLTILAPADMSRARGAALYDVNNRGNKLALSFFNRGGSGGSNPGDGFLMRHGWVVVWSGWDGELLPEGARMQLHAPVAGTAKHPIVGPVRYEISVTGDGPNRRPINGGGHGAYRPTANGLETATLTWRQQPEDPRVPIPRNQYTLYVQEIPSDKQGQLPRVDLELHAGFQPGLLYELIYEAQDPLVHGVTFASVRDLMSALKHGSGKNNPLLHNGKPIVKRNHGFGVSQSGRYLRELLYFGFNADESGRKVFDGLIPHVAGGGLGSFNHRFAQPTAYNSQHIYHEWPSDRFPFTYSEQTDHITGRKDSILRRAAAANVQPFVLHTQSAAEYWTRSGSLAHTNTQATKDAEIPDNVRVYAFGGTQHGPAGYPPGRGIAQTDSNPGDYKPLLRALLTRLDDWAAGKQAAPPSVYPKISDGTLVDFRESDFPRIPGVRYPNVIQAPPALDCGRGWPDAGIISQQPPKVIGRYSVRIPRCGTDGNDLGCLIPPEVAVPLATYTGWSLRATTAGAQNQLVKLTGSSIPFPLTAFEREWTGDPRQSIQEQYPSVDSYRGRMEAKCKAYAAAGYLMEEDIEFLVTKYTQRAKTALDQIKEQSVVESGPVQLLKEGAGEGPAWHPELGLLFSGHGGINRRHHDGTLSNWRKDAGTNGLLFDRKGRLVACEPGQRRVTRTELDGTITVLTEGYKGAPYNQPNDLAIDSKGRIYFSDPKYGPRTNMELKDANGREVEGVYRIDPDGTVTRVITHEADRPNGLLITPDDRYLYVADNNNNSIGGSRTLLRFNLSADGSVDTKSRRVIYDWQTGRGPDGMIADEEGRLYVAGGRNKPVVPFETADRHVGGVYVFSPDGRLIDLIRIPRDEVTNCTFGGPDKRTLFITAGGSLWSARIRAKGVTLFP